MSHYRENQPCPSLFLSQQRLLGKNWKKKEKREISGNRLDKESSFQLKTEGQFEHFEFLLLFIFLKKS